MAGLPQSRCPVYCSYSYTGLFLTTELLKTRLKKFFGRKGCSSVELYAILMHESISMSDS